ncbi:hedgehog acyltransferase [Cricetulus griseus]
MCRAPANPVSENPGAAFQSQALTPTASDPRCARASFPGRGGWGRLLPRAPSSAGGDSGDFTRARQAWPSGRRGARGESEGARVERRRGAWAATAGARVEKAGGLAGSWRGRWGLPLQRPSTISPARRQGAGRGAAAGRGRLAADVGQTQRRFRFPCPRALGRRNKGAEPGEPQTLLLRGEGADRAATPRPSAGISLYRLSTPHWEPVTSAMLPRWEMALCLLASLGFHFYSFYEVYKVSREHEDELDQEFELERDTLFGGLKKDPTDFEWNFWLEWGRRSLVWLFLGHAAVSQLAILLARKHRPWIVMVYGMWACWCVLGAPGVAMVFLHTTIAFCVAQFRSMLLSWLCSLLLLSTLRLQSVEEVKRKWYKTENEYYLLQFTLTVRCLYYTSFSLELCRQPPSAQRTSYSFPWLLAFVFYYPVFHNGPIINFPEFFKQMQQPEPGSPKHSLAMLARGLGRLLCWWWLAELMVHLMYMHALYNSSPLLESASCWTLGLSFYRCISLTLDFGF